MDILTPVVWSQTELIRIMSIFIISSPSSAHHSHIWTVYRENDTGRLFGCKQWHHFHSLGREGAYILFIKCQLLLVAFLSFSFCVVIPLCCICSSGTWTAGRTNRSEGSLWSPVPFHYTIRQVYLSTFYVHGHKPQYTQYGSVWMLLLVVDSLSYPPCLPRRERIPH